MPTDRSRAIARPTALVPHVDDAAAETTAGTIQAVERSLRLLLLLANAPRPRTLHELSAVMGCSTSTVHRLLTTLSEANLVEKESVQRRYRLGPAVFDLAEARARQTDVRDVARPHLEALADASLETVALDLLVKDRLVCLDRIDSVQDLRLVSALGAATPLWDLGAKCKSVLAHLPALQQTRVIDQIRWERGHFTRTALRQELAKIRERGVARSFGERVPVAASIAAPMFGRDGKVIACMSIAGPNARWTASGMDELEPALRDAVRQISYDLGYRS